MAIACDDQGTGFEVHPASLMLAPGPDSAIFLNNQNGAGLGAVHAALSVQLSAEAVRAIAAGAGWTCREVSRGGDFSVLELWVEDRFLIEVMPPEMTAQYLAACRRMGNVSDAEAVMASHVAS